MQRKLSIFLLMCMVPGVAFGAIGDIDTRRVVGWIDNQKPSYVDKNIKNDWNTDKYNKIVFIIQDDGFRSWSGTGSWISPRHILTAKHVVTDEKNNTICGIKGKGDCDVYLSDGTALKAKTVIYDSETGGQIKNDKYAYDWAILEISDEKYCNKNYYDGYVSTKVGSGLWRAGFGGLRVLTNEDIKNIKKAYKEFLDDIDKKVQQGTPITKNASDARDMKKAKGAAETVYVVAARESSVFLTKFKELTGSDFIKDYLDDSFTLKYIENCRINSIDEPGLAQHDCYGWHGDSGGSIIDSASNKIISIDVGGSDFIAAPDYIFEIGVTTQRIFNTDVLAKINEAKQKCSNNQTPVVADKPATVPTKIITLNKNGGTGIIKNNTGTTFTETNDGEISCTSENTVNLPTWASGANSNNTTNIAKGVGTDSKVFLGWSTKSTCATSICATTSIACPASNTTYYAVWGTPQCSVTNGSTTIATTVENKPTCAVKCNNGYQISGTYSGTANQLIKNYTCSGNIITLIWANGGHGTAPKSPANCTYGGNVTTPAAMTENGWTFNNWKIGDKTFNANTSIACNYTNLGAYSGSVTLTGQWTANSVTSEPPASRPSTTKPVLPKPIKPNVPVTSTQPVNADDDMHNTSADVFKDIDKFIKRNINETSSWTEDDGSFNTARLISDSVSVVVLGTVGSVITSVVIKQNQTKHGFESLKCTIGGQSVATYGDVFKVGVKE